jgi:hypothetical protein
MSDRLSGALIATARTATARPGEDLGPSWLLIDGVDVALARSLVAAWPGDLPPVFVAAAAGEDFGEADLARSSATRERNLGGICLIVCEGQRVPDGQSVVGFERCGPELLLGADGAMLLAEQPPVVSELPGVQAVVEALGDPKLASPPSVRAITAFLDSAAGGTGVAESLPLIGGFRESGDSASVTPQRVVANLNLASGRSSAERLAPSSLAEIRERASRALNSEAAERFVELLLARDDALLAEFSYNQAVAALEQPPAAELPAQVRGDLERYAAERPDCREEMFEVFDLASALDDPLLRKDAAQQLLELDVAHQGEILARATRRRLKSQRRDRSVSEPSIEAGLLRAIDGLASPLKSIELREPLPRTGGSSEAALKAIVAVAAAHVRLAPILRRLAKGHGVRVDGALETEPGPQLRGALNELQSRGANALRPVKLAVRGVDRGDSVEVNWTPSPEELALLVAATRFADANPPALQLRSTASDGRVTLSTLSAVPAPEHLAAPAAALRGAASAILRDGYDVAALRAWAVAWTEAVAALNARGATGRDSDCLALAGCIETADEVAMTSLAPLKSEWLAARTEAWLELTDLAARAAAGEEARSPGDTQPPPIVPAARAVGAATAARYPAFVATGGRETPLLPTSDASVFASFGDSGSPKGDVAPRPVEPIQTALRKLLDLHPEAAEHVRCAAWGPGACDLLTRAIAENMRRSDRIGRAELFCLEGAPEASTLAMLDDFARTQPAQRIQLRYVDNLREWGADGDSAPSVHLALVEGITHGAERVNANYEDFPAPPSEEDVLFTPRTWARPRRSRVLLAPPRLSTTGLAWHRLMTAAVEDEWPNQESPVFRVPELRTDAAGARDALDVLHRRALWVATLDRYATRDTIRHAVGDDVAILHQERRVAGDAVYGLVISQRSGSNADRAIARSLRASGLLDETAAPGVAAGLRQAASRGYGILALRAATTGSGINELIGHVAAFYRLTSDATPWPLPPDLRVILLSLDEYGSWFGGGKRADLLALALSPEEGGVHAANIEVKAVKNSGEPAQRALNEAREQLRKTLIDSRFAAYPNGSLFTRLWLNRIVDAAIGVCRENDFRLSADDLEALDNFRMGEGDLEWAGVAMIFSPGAAEPLRHSHIPLMGDRVPIVEAIIPLTPELLADAAGSDGTQLRTAASGRSILASSTKRRQFSRGAYAAGLEPPEVARTAVPETADVRDDVGEVQESGAEPRDAAPAPAPAGEAAARPEHPVIGWDVATNEPVEWRVTGPGALSNGHVEIYGTSGAGKTQFVMSLLSQLKAMGSCFGVCDFKNDYFGDFPTSSGAQFFDLWEDSLPFNPLAIDDPSRRNLQALAIELRDTAEIAASAYGRLGRRQLGKLQQAFEESFEQARTSGRRAPTLADVHELLDEDMRGVIGDLTGTGLFGDGPPLGSVVNQDVIFGLNRIPGTGMTTTLAAGFILAALYLKLLEMPQVANKVTYTMVIDEAHRVARFHSVGSMVRELRSKGLAVILATQKPGDLPEEASTNAQTKIFMRLPDAQSARDAGRAIDPARRELPEMIRTLDDGEAYVAFAGAAPRLVRLKQFWRDHPG